MRAEGEHMKKLFQSTSSIQRKTNSVSWAFLNSNYFNPLPLYRGRPMDEIIMLKDKVFQSTSSIQRKTFYGQTWHVAIVFQSTSSIQRKTRPLPPGIHSLQFQSTSSIQRKTFLPPWPRMAGKFQSTSSIQRKTANINKWISFIKTFYI